MTVIETEDLKRALTSELVAELQRRGWTVHPRSLTCEIKWKGKRRD